MFVADIYEGLPGVLGGTREHGGFCSGNTGTIQENHREKGTRNILGTGEQSLFPGKNTNSIMT